MSILIKGMEMPTGERPVHVEIHRDGTVIQWKFGESDEIIGTAVEVPPHGRLIDMDVILAQLREMSLDDCSLAEDLIEHGIDDVLDDAPTIIEAEE